MNLDDRIRDVAAHSAWCRDVAAALSVVPGLADLPELVEGAGQERAILPLGVIGPLAAPMLDALEQLVAAHDAGAARESWHLLSADAALRDPVVAALVNLHLAAARPGLRLGSLCALGVAWISSRVLTGAAADVAFGTAALTDRGRALQRYVHGVDVRARGPLLAAVAWGLQGRIGAAASIAQSANSQVALGPLHRAVAQSPLALTCARGTLDAERDHSLLVSVLGLDLRPPLLEAAHQAVAALLSGPLAAGAGPAATPALVAAQDLLRRRGLTGASGAAVLLDPVAGITLLAGLPDLFAKGELEKAGLPKALATALMQRDGCRALAATWRDATGPLLEWDLLTAVLDRVQPVLRGAEVAGDGFDWDIGHWRRTLLFPASTDAAGAIVAADLSSLAARLQGAPASSGSWGAERVWAQLTDGEGFCQGTHGLALCDSVERAVELALAIDGRVKAGFVVSRGHLGEPVEFPRGGALGLGVVAGIVSGVSDGVSIVLDGPALARALSLAGCASVDAAHGVDPTGLRRAVHTPAGVAGSGVAVDPDAVAALRAALDARRTPQWSQGRPSTLPGFDGGFEALPVAMVWHGSDGLRLMLQAGADGPHEVMAIDEDDLRALRTRDASLQQRARQGAAPVAAAPAALPDWGFDDALAASPAVVAAGGLAIDEPAAAVDDPFGAFDLPATAASAEDDPFAFLQGPATSSGAAAPVEAAVDEAADSADAGDFGDFGDFADFGHVGGGAAPAAPAPGSPSASAPAGAAGDLDFGDIAVANRPTIDLAENPFSDLSVSGGGGGAPVDPWEAEDDAMSGPLLGLEDEIAPTVPPTRLIAAPMTLDDSDLADDVDSGTSADRYASSMGSGPTGWTPRPVGADGDSAEGGLVRSDPDDFSGGGPLSLAMVGPPMMLDETDPGDQAPHPADWTFTPAARDVAGLPLPTGHLSDEGAESFVVPDFDLAGATPAAVSGDLPSSPGAASADVDDVASTAAEIADEPRFDVPWDLVSPRTASAADGPMVDIEEDWDDPSSDRMVHLRGEAGADAVDAARGAEPPWASGTGGAELPGMGHTDDGPSPGLGAFAPDLERGLGYGSIDVDHPGEAPSAFDFSPPSDRGGDAPGRALRESFHSQDPGPFDGIAEPAGVPLAAHPPGVTSAGLNLAGMFSGYREYEGLDGAVTFGMRDGPRLRDAHRYAVSGDRAEAYRRFLKDKVAEGFAPRLELTAPFSSDSNTAREIDGGLLASAYSRMFT